MLCRIIFTGICLFLLCLVMVAGGLAATLLPTMLPDPYLTDEGYLEVGTCWMIYGPLVSLALYIFGIWIAYVDQI